MDIYSLSRTTTRANIMVLDDDGGKVRGSIRGPFCKFSRTLPTTYPITDGRAVVVDPCYWTPALPFRYEVVLRIDGANGETREQEFLWGIRWCTTHKQDLRLDGKRFVIRAIQPNNDDFDLALFRELACALMIDSPGSEICEEASELGVIVFDSAVASTNSERELNRHAAVHFACAAKSSKSDVLSVSADPHPDSRVLMSNEDAVSAPSDRPTFIQRRVPKSDIADMRRACDSLQRDMANQGQFAGYLITHA